MSDIKEYFELRKQQIHEYFSELQEAVVMTEQEKEGFKTGALLFLFANYLLLYKEKGLSSEDTIKATLEEINSKETEEKRFDEETLRKRLFPIGGIIELQECFSLDEVQICTMQYLGITKIYWSYLVPCLERIKKVLYKEYKQYKAIDEIAECHRDVFLKILETEEYGDEKEKEVIEQLREEFLDGRFSENCYTNDAEKSISGLLIKRYERLENLLPSLADLGRIKTIKKMVEFLADDTVRQLTMDFTYLCASDICDICINKKIDGIDLKESEYRILIHILEPFPREIPNYLACYYEGNREWYELLESEIRNETLADEGETTSEQEDAYSSGDTTEVDSVPMVFDAEKSADNNVQAFDKKKESHETSIEYLGGAEGAFDNPNEKTNLPWMGTLPQNKWTEQEKDIFCKVFASHCTPSDPDLIKYLFWGTVKEGKGGWNFSKIVWDSDKNGNSKNKGLFVSFLSVLYEGRNIPNTRFIQDVFGVDTDRKRDKIEEVKRQLAENGLIV